MASGSMLNVGGIAVRWFVSSFSSAEKGAEKDPRLEKKCGCPTKKMVRANMLQLSYHGESSCLGNTEYVSQMGRGQHLHPRKLTCNPKKIGGFGRYFSFSSWGYFQLPKCWATWGLYTPHISPLSLPDPRSDSLVFPPPL